MDTDITSLVDSFLNNPPAVRRNVPTTPTPRASHITESTVKQKIRRGITTYTESEVRLIGALLEQAESDPFSGDAFMTPDDLKSLGLKTVDSDTEVFDGGEGDEGEGEEGNRDVTPDSAREPMEKFPVTAALCAPDNTVGSSEPIPQEVLATIEVLKSSEPEQTYAAKGASPAPVAAPQASPQQAPANNEPVQDAFKDSGIEKTQSNDILQTFESKEEDYMAQARAAMLGETVVSAGHQGSAETASGAVAMVKSFRKAKLTEDGPRYVRKNDVPPELAAKYAGKMSALSGPSDNL
jgi:hypothetical protein